MSVAVVALDLTADRALGLVATSLQGKALDFATPVEVSKDSE
jgi:hypothetical protein